MQTTQMYAALLAEHIQEHSIRLLGATFDFISPEEASENFGREDLDEAKPHAGGIAGPSWTDAELDRFFSALGRHSRLRPDLIAQDVGTKNIVQVTVYLSALAAGSAEVLLGETETPTRLDAWALKSSRRSRETRRRKRNLALRRKMPAAREVSAHWLAFEEREAQKVQELEDRLGARMAGADEAAYLKRDVGVRNVKGKEREIECSPEPMPACSQVSKLFEPIHFDEQVRAVVLFLRHRPALDPLQNTPNALACAPTIAPQPVHAFALSRVVQQLFRRSNQGNAAHVRREYELFARTHPVPPIQSYDDAWRVAYRAGELGFFVYYSRGTFGVPNDGVADASSTAEGRQSGDGTPLQGTAPVHEGRKPLPELTLLGGTGSSNRLPRKMSMLPEVAPYTSWRVSWTDAFFDVASATYAQSGPAHDDERATPNVPVPDASGDVQALLRTESRNAAICLAYVREQARARVLNTLDTQEMAWAEGRRGSARSRSRSMSKASSAAGSGSSSLAPDDASEPGGDASARGGLGKEGLRKVNEKLASKLRAGGADPTKRNGSPADASSGVEAGDGDGEGCMFHGFDLSALTPAARVRAKQRLRSRIKQHGLEAAQAMPFEVEKGRPKADATMISGLEHLLEGLEGDERRRVESRLRARVRKYGIEKTKSMPLGPAKRGRRKQGESLLPDGTDSEALTTQPGTPRGHGHGNGEGRSGNGASERSEAELAEIGEDGDETQGTTDVDGGRAVKRGSYRYRDGTQWSIGSKGRRFLAIGLDGTQSGGVAAPPSSLPPALGAANGMDDGASANSSVLGPAMEQELGWINLRSLSILLR